MIVFISDSLLVGMQSGAVTVEDGQSARLCDSASVLLGVYPNALKPYVQTKTYTWKFYQLYS